MIKWGTDIPHSFLHGSVVDVGVHVPNKTGGDCDESAPLFAQTPSEQQQLPKIGSVIGVVFVVVPLSSYLVGAHQRPGIEPG